MTIQTRRGWLSAALTLAAVVLVHPHASLQGAEPPPDTGKGKRIYQQLCAGCHGPKGRGDGYTLLGPKPADLAAPSTLQKTDRDLLRTLHEGKPNMPAWNRRLSEPEARDVLAYIRSLNPIR
jgi:mono/diheme cytochrome c family protein